MNTLDKSSPRRWGRRSLWQGILLLLIVALGLALWGPTLVGKGIRLAASHWLGKMGLQLEVGGVRAEWGSPLQWKEVRIWPGEGESSRTEIRVAQLEAELNPLWKLPFGNARILRALRVQGLQALLDLEDSSGRWHALRNWPERVEIQGPELQVLSPLGLVTSHDLDIILSQQALGRISVSNLAMETAARRIQFETVEGVTAWKLGALYLADLALGEDLKLENFRLDLARRAGPDLGLDATLFGASLRADVAFDSQGLDAAIWVSKLDLERVSKLLGLEGEAEGILREGRFTFRGQPRTPRDGQASLRLVADGFRWNKRGWESLKVGANFIHRRLVVSDFSLRQKENTVQANGEVSLEDMGLNWSRAPFLMNVSASIKDLGALSALFGHPFEETSGRMSLSSAVSGRDGRMEGYLSLETAPMVMRGRKFESGRVEVTFNGTEAEVTQCEFWSGKDHFEGMGTIAFPAPHRYAGKIVLSVGDVGAYAKVWPWPHAFPALGGRGHFEWEGDGTWTAHSGAFAAELTDWVSTLSPAGLTGVFKGSYSPENFYFGTLNLRHGNLELSTRATLARSGVGLQDGILREGGKTLAEGEVFLPVDIFAVLEGAPLRASGVADKAPYLRFATQKPLALAKVAGLLGSNSGLGGTIEGALEITGKAEALEGKGALSGRDLSWRGRWAIEGLSGGLGFVGSTLRIGPFRGRLDDGPFVLQGQADLSGAGRPDFVLNFLGRDMDQDSAAKNSSRVDAEWRVSRQATLGIADGFVRLGAESGKVGAVEWPEWVTRIWSSPPRFRSWASPLFGPWEVSLSVTMASPVPFFDRLGKEWVQREEQSLLAIFAVPQWQSVDRPW